MKRKWTAAEKRRIGQAVKAAAARRKQEQKTALVKKHEHPTNKKEAQRLTDLGTARTEYLPPAGEWFTLSPKTHPVKQTIELLNSHGLIAVDEEPGTTYRLFVLGNDNATRKARTVLFAGRV